MLTLRRTDGQAVILFLEDGTSVTVRLVNCKRGAGKLEIEAPRRIRILREELTERGPDGESERRAG